MPNIRRRIRFPRPENVDALAEIGHGEHIPLAIVRLGEQTTIVVTKTLSSPKGTSAFFRVGEVYFPSMQLLEACAASDGGKEVRAHGIHFSSSETPLFLAAEDAPFTVA